MSLIYKINYVKKYENFINNITTFYNDFLIIDPETRSYINIIYFG